MKRQYKIVTQWYYNQESLITLDRKQQIITTTSNFVIINSHFPIVSILRQKKLNIKIKPDDSN
jgi:hypothetical protein